MASSGRNIRKPAPARSPRRPASARPPAASELTEAFDAALGEHRGAIAVAVSGGSDSLALMHLLAAFARARKLPPPLVLTVDHGLRKGSDKDARQVAAWAKKAGLKARVLTWRGKKPNSGIEAAAREARYRLMGEVLEKGGIASLFVGHTQDDQAETFLLRLARGSGLDGLCAMRGSAPWPVPGFASLSIRRPLLEVSRDRLRALLAERGQAWLEDPMNQDDAFDRVRIRKARAALEGAGLSAHRIAAAAQHLARARQTLEMVTQAVLARAARAAEGGILLDSVALTAAPREVGLRALAGVLQAVSGAAYRPRFESLERLLELIATKGGGASATLQGCHIGRAPAGSAPHDLMVRREKPRKTVSSGKRQK